MRCWSLARYFSSPIFYLLLSFSSSQQQVIRDGTTETLNITSSSNNFDDAYSHIYQVQLELKTIKINESNIELQRRLSILVERAFTMAAYKHRKQLPPADFSTTKSEYTTQVISKRAIGESTFLNFVTFANDEPISGDVVAEDLNDLTVSQISAILHYPLEKIISFRDIENQSGVKWWFIAGILGIGAVLFVIGWFILFIYFNTCGASRRCEEGDYMTRAQRAQLQKGIIINPSPPWTRGIYDHPLGEPWVDPGPIQSNDGDDKAAEARRQRYKRSFRTLSEAKLEKRLKEEKEAISKATAEAKRKISKTREHEPQPAEIEEASSSTELTSANELENITTTRAKNEKNVAMKKRQTKIGPIAIATATTMNEEASEISGVSSSEDLGENVGAKKKEEKKKTGAEINDGWRLPPLKKRSKSQSEIKSEPESDYGSSTNDEETKIMKKFQVGSAKVRPLAAGKQRTSLFEKEDTNQAMKHIPRVWTPYFAGDKVTNFWRNKREIYPMPGTPTSEDVFEITVEK